MMRRGEMSGAARDSTGAVLVFVALLLPVMIGVGGLVVDAGNWFSHKRHLQVQADAGALAGAGRFQAECVGKVANAVVAEARKYASVDDTTPSYNPQSGGTPPERLHTPSEDESVFAINSKTFYKQSAPVDDTVNENSDPCEAGMIDVKLTETDLPWFLKVAQVKYINAHARVEIRQQTIGGAGALPVGVPEVGPQKARALFVDEATGAVIASTNLVRIGTSAGLALWSNASAPVSVTVDAAKIGLRIVLSGATSTQCGDPLVDCYGAGTNTAVVANTPGLVHLRGWSSAPAGTAAAPQARDVELRGATCEDGSFTATAAASPCTVDVDATVDFGTAPPTLATTRVFARRADANANTAVALTAPAAITGPWTGGALPVVRGEGPVGIVLRWGTGCTSGKENSCSASGPLGTVQRAFAGNESLAVSGPIKLLRVTEAAAPASSLQRCSTCAYDLVVTLGLKPALELAEPGDPFVSLKIAGGGSQNQALDCDPDVPNFRDEIANGCGPQYEVNDGQPCPGYAGTPGGANDLWNTPEPWKCVVISTGAVVGQATQGMNKRILGATNPSSCTASNNWASYPDLPPGDPRIVQVFLTPFGAFTGSGGTTVPVTGFATFYVTGWDGGACQGLGDDPAGQGAIVGHFIKYIDTLGTGGGGEAFCDFDALGSCVAVFTR